MSGTAVLAIGECMVELSPQSDGLYAMGFAGDTFNTTWYLRHLLPAARIAYLTALGCDLLSDRMAAFIAGQGIDTGHIARLDGATVGLYVIELSGAERSFTYWRGASAARRLADDASCLRKAVAEARLIYLSGITLAILPEAGREHLFAVLADAKAVGKILAFDPNMRPSLWPDAPTMRDWVGRLAGLADVVLPSFDEEAREFGDLAPALVAKRYLGLGAGLVVIKNGADEIVAADRRETWRHVPRSATALLDTTAAGDSFNAGFLTGYLRALPVERGLALGSEVAREVIAARGALVPLSAELLAWAAQT